MVIAEKFVPERDSELERNIKYKEMLLGIDSPETRLLETSLFIDRPFIEFALITGYPPQPERIFGDQSWNNYLNARIALKTSDDDHIGIIPIITLWDMVATNSYVDPYFRPFDSRGRGASHDELRKPLVCTNDQINAINQNPWLIFSQDGEDPNSGFIQYPKLEPIRLRREIQSLCIDYNQKNSKKETSSYENAAMLQRKFISLHPLRDYNGTVSRLLMNWSLEMNGLPPSALLDFDLDIFLSEAEWVKEVRLGSERYERMRERIRENNTNDLAEIFGVKEERDFYQEAKEELETPPPLIPGRQHKHTPYKNFLRELRASMPKK